MDLNMPKLKENPNPTKPILLGPSWAPLLLGHFIVVGFPVVTLVVVIWYALYCGPPLSALNVPKTNSTSLTEGGLLARPNKGMNRRVY